MKDFDLEMQRFSMADSDDYDEYEEEVIERDEEYDDGEDYDDEEYDDDAEYDDGEEYDDDAEYDDDYDDGYDDNYYDERLNKVLDELAELKRAVANPPAVQNNQPSYVQPSIPYVYAGNLPQNQAQQNNSGEVLMYNEISRLRDELSKTQSSQNLHVELNRLKDEMERDRKYNESQYLNEIKRLNEKIETLQKNSLSPQSEDDGALPESALEGGSVDNGNVQKLIAINEAILKSSRSADSRVRNELADIKKRLAGLDTSEISGLISSVKALPQGGMNTEDMKLLTEGIMSIKQSISAAGIAPVASGDNATAARIAELQARAMDDDSDAVVLLKSMTELALAIGCDEQTAKAKKAALALMDEFIAFRMQVGELSLGDALTLYSDIVSRVSALECTEAAVLASACDKLGEEILRTPLDKKSSEDLIKFADDMAQISINREKREALDKFVTLSQRLVKAEAADVKEILPQLLEAKSKLQSNVKQAADTSLAAEIDMLIDSDKTDGIKERLAKICELRPIDFVRFSRVSVMVPHSEEKSVASLVSKLDEMLGMLSSRVSEAASAQNESSAASENTNTGAAPDDNSIGELKEEIVKLCTAQQLEQAIAELKNQYVSLLKALTSLPEGAVNSEAVATASAEAQYSNNELSDQIYNVRDELNKAIHDENLLTQDTVELKLSDIADAQTSAHRQMSDDIKTIKNTLISLQELVESMSGTGETVRRETVAEEVTDENQETETKVPDDIYEQFDKLYEDISTLLATTENNVVDRLSETVGSTMDNVNTIIDSINANIDNINALVTNVNTSLDSINNNFDTTNESISTLSTSLVDSLSNISLSLDEVKDNVSLLAASDVSMLIGDKVDELKLAIDDFVAKVNANDEAAFTDRTQLLEDVTYLRGREEARAAGEETTSADAVIAELEQFRDNITRDLNVLTDTVSGLNIDEMREHVSIIRDTLDVLASDTSVSAMGEDVTAIREGQNAVLDAVTNASAAQEELKATLTEDLAYIRSRLDESAQSEQTDEQTVGIADVYDTLAAVNDKIDAISLGEQEDTQTLIAHLEEIKEQLHLKELEPSIEGITDSESEKQSLLNEIAEVRERLATLEESSQLQSDDAIGRLQAINDELTALKESVLTVSEPKESSELDTLLADLSVKIDGLSIQNDGTAEQLAALAPIADDLAQIKETLSLEKDGDSDNGIADIMQTVNDMSDKVKDMAERMEVASVSLDSIPLVLSELDEVKTALAEIKESLASGDEQSEGIIVDDSEDIARRLDILDDKTNEIIERSETGMVDETLHDEIAEIRENLLSDYEKIKEDISFIRNQIELNVEDSDSEDTSLTSNDEDIGTILEDLSEIKEKLSASEEYDIMAEILSLREDIKASRVAESGDENIDAVRAEIAEKNDAILSEIVNLKDEIAAMSAARTSEDSAAELPTNDELNMVLSEIVSLRDEIQSYKDELSVHAQETVQPQVDEEEPAAVADRGLSENIDVILDELTGLRSELIGVKDETREVHSEEIEPLKVGIEELNSAVAELKDMISRRVSITEPVDGAADSSATGLNVVLDELANLKRDFTDEINSLHEAMGEEKEEGGDVESRLVAIEDSLAAIDEKLVGTENRPVEDFALADKRHNEILEAIGQLKAPEHAEGEEDDTFDVLSEMLLLHNEMTDIKSLLSSGDKSGGSDLAEEIGELRSMVENLSASTDYEKVLEELTQIKEQLAKSQPESSEIYEQDDGEEIGVNTDDSYNLREDLAEIRELLMQRQSEDRSDEIEMLRDEITGLRQEISGVGITEQTQGEVSFGAEMLALRDEIASLKEQLASGTPVVTSVEAAESDMGVMTEVMALRDEIASLKEQLASGTPVVTSAEATEPDMGVMTEVMALRDEIASLKEQLASGTPVVTNAEATEPDMTVLAEIMALREEMNAWREAMSKPDTGLAETVEQIREDVRVMKDEPDLSALNEVLALRDEFQAMKDELAGRTAAQEGAKSNDEILSEVQQLRDQMFAISMANVNDGSTDKVTYESYNNIILDEITALREELNAYKAQDATQPIMDEIAEIKSSIAAQTADESELMMQFAKLKNDLQSLKNSEEADATNNAILAQLETLKTELKNQREADLTSLNFMSEMAQLIERQNRYLNQSDNSKITNEIESLKAEIASSLATPAVETSAIMNEISQLKAEISRGTGRSVNNEEILNELAKLKAEISAEKPSDRNDMVLEEITRLKEEIVALSEKNAEQSKDIDAEEISRSISDLKNELTQIADMVSDDEKPQVKKKPSSSTKSKSTRSSKSGSTSKSTSGKRGRPKGTSAKKSTVKKTEKVAETESVNSDELLSKIDAATFEIPGDEKLALDPTAVGKSEDDDLDLASKLAKQVANKLIMEQLVVQLGDGGVPENEVEEIVKDILPTEFTTVQIEEQSDQVRRLANSLVLDKLRARLTGKNNDDEDNE